MLYWNAVWKIQDWVNERRASEALTFLGHCEFLVSNLGKTWSNQVDIKNLGPVSFSRGITGYAIGCLLYIIL